MFHVKHCGMINLFLFHNYCASVVFIMLNNDFEKVNSKGQAPSKPTLSPCDLGSYDDVWASASSIAPPNPYLMKYCTIIIKILVI